MTAEFDETIAVPARPSKEILIGLRFEKGMTREDIAEHFNTSVATVRRWIKELGVPRPVRKQKPIKLTSLGGSGEIVASLDDGYTRFERARMVLEGRVVERTGLGYYLDGRPASADDIMRAAAV